MSVEITKLNQADIGHFRQLFQAVFGREMDAQMFQWKYIDNPCQTDKESYNIIVAKDGDRLVGARPALVMNIFYKGKLYQAAQPCDTMLLPDYRGKRLFSGMIEYALKYLREQGMEYFFNFPNTNSYPGNIRNGWSSNGAVMAGIKVFSLKSTVVSRLGRGRFVYSYTPDSSPAKDFDLSVSAPPGAEELFQDTFKDSNCIAQYRSEQWLNWRFQQNPNNKIYRFLAMKSSDQLVGYAVLALTASGGGEIVDYLVRGHDPELFSKLLKGCIQWFRSQKVRQIKTWYAHPLHRRILNSHLFIPRKLKIYHVYRGFEDTDALWYINMGDTDTQ
ncbi:MAG: GNAT family N-acetyltransferase [Bacillota bacterium]|jgi:GNAT superfamily N-acetyltransferase|nr:GNAT family N-acetyltransferase [Bacillota bacterium]HPZ21875.1 GNAT family N-acetyltransferase [Bacillota bacterium]